MGFTNSPLATFTKISPNQSGPRKYPLTRITIHCVVGQCNVQSLGGWFAQESTRASSNYGVGFGGGIGLYVPESNRSWCSSSSDNDNRAITIEVASDTTAPYAVRPAAYSALLDLVTDICKRNGKKRLLWFGDKDKALAYAPAADEMVLTVHRWFANKSCPGDYLYNRHPEIAAEVNKRLGASPAAEQPQEPATPEALEAGTKLTLQGVKIYKSSAAATESGTRTGTFYIWSKDAIKGRIRITNKTGNVGVSGQVTGWITLEDARAAAAAAATTGSAPAVQTPATFQPYLVRIIASILNVRRGPGTTYAITTQIRRGEVYTIVGEENGWGKLKSGAGWIYLGYTERR